MPNQGDVHVVLGNVGGWLVRIEEVEQRTLAWQARIKESEERDRGLATQVEGLYAADEGMRTEMRKIKHAYDTGVLAKKGIDY